METERVVFQIPLKLHVNQVRVHNSQARFVVLMAGRKFGKTLLAVYECLRAAAKRNQVVWYVAPTYSQAEDIAWREFLQYMPNKLIKRVNVNKLVIEWINGSVIQLKGADKEGRLRGPRVDYMVLDEAQDLKPFIWEEELRPNLLYSRGGALFIGTPSGRNWFWRLWNDAKRRKEWSAYQFASWDNPLVSSEERERVERETPQNILRQEYYAEANENTGIVYDELNPLDHIVPIRYPDPGRPVYMAIDWGLHDPTCVLWAFEDTNGDLVVFQEHYQSGWTVEKQAARIREMSGNLNIAWTVIDPTTNKRDPNNFRTVFSTFHDFGIPCIPGDNRRPYGIAVVKKYLTNKKLKITENCKNLIRELGELEWRDTGVSTTEEYRRVNDHAHDAMKYLLCRHVSIASLEDPVSRAIEKRSGFAYVPLGMSNHLNLPEDLEAVFHGQF